MPGWMANLSSWVWLCQDAWQNGCMMRGEGDAMEDRYDILVNRSHLLPRDYIPGNLVPAPFPFDRTGPLTKRLLRRQAADSAAALFQKAAQKGIPLWGVSGYRPFSRQEEIYRESLAKNGLAHTEQYIAPPGASEHQTGLALDVSTLTLGLALVEDFAKTDAGTWLAEYAPLYGFILRYPRGKEHITGFAWEPWHIRYVTPPIARFLANTGLVLEEYSYRL